MKNSLWDYSLSHYHKPGVEKACLQLQDDFSLDVNIVFLCCFYAQHYGALSTQQINKLKELSYQWQNNLIKNLRQSRRWLKKKDAELLRQGIKELELNAEKHYMQLLQETSISNQQVIAANVFAYRHAAKNFHNYCESENTENTEKNSELQQPLATVLSATMSLSAADARDALNNVNNHD